jgi:hypothetical protein
MDKSKWTPRMHRLEVLARLMFDHFKTVANTARELTEEERFEVGKAVEKDFNALEDDLAVIFPGWKEM